MTDHISDRGGNYLCGEHAQGQTRDSGQRETEGTVDIGAGRRLPGRGDGLDDGFGGPNALWRDASLVGGAGGRNLLGDILRDREPPHRRQPVRPGHRKFPGGHTHTRGSAVAQSGRCIAITERPIDPSGGMRYDPLTTTRPPRPEPRLCQARPGWRRSSPDYACGLGGEGLNGPRRRLYRRRQ